MIISDQSSLLFFFAQDDTTTSNGNKDSFSFDGMSDTEVEKRLKVC